MRQSGKCEIWSFAQVSKGLTSAVQHIDVCICTYKRPELLKRLLEKLADQETEGRLTYSVVVVDNDRLRSAEPVVSANSSGVPVRYCVEVQQSIPLARNMAVENAQGDYIAFIDDDEFPTKRWLLSLLVACETYGVAGALGPVRPYFSEGAPDWVKRGKFYDRPSYPTGSIIDWRKGRTGNVLLKAGIIKSCPQPFSPDFRTGEDQDFFRRMIERGHSFVWCDEAVAYEMVPEIRWNRKFMLKRALLRGANSLAHPTFGAVDAAKSIIAVPIYTTALPFALLCGHHLFMSLLVKTFDHLGKLLALIGIKPISDQYVTE
jgi:glycosyltransferase involved in cell wall biosynthesis